MASGATRARMDTRRSVHQKQYEHHMPDRTDLRMTGANNGTISTLLLTISNVYADGGVTDVPSNRSWVFRVHLAPGEVLQHVAVQGAPIQTTHADMTEVHGNGDEALSAYARILQPRPRVMHAADTAPVGVPPPIGGVGTPPAPHAGPIVEVHYAETNGMCC